jgi:hypothetical protein
MIAAAMRRLARHLFTLSAAVSLLLCLAAGGMWVRSYGRGDLVTYSAMSIEDGAQRHRGIVAWSGAGGFYFAGLDVTAVPIPGQLSATHPYTAKPWRWTWNTKPSPRRTTTASPAFDVLGFWWEGHWRQANNDREYNRKLSEFFLGVPYWFTMLLAAAMPAKWFVHVRRRRSRVARGLCVRCGYDLRESPKRCPECGAVTRLKKGFTAETQRRGEEEMLAADERR